jgi:predicted metalloprotease with PDZ domain
VPHRFKLAMATHNEYDDKFYRFVRDFRVEAAGGGAYGAGGHATAERTDSAVYNISVPGDQAVVTYRIRLPVHRFAHQPFLSRNGGLVGDIHSFFYLVGSTKIPATVNFDLPAGWTIATGLEPTADRHTFRASSAKMLMDCPVLTGHLRQWHFVYGSIPYTVNYLPVAGTGPPAFDTALLAANIKKIVGVTVSLFGRVPYRHYDFLLVDGVYGALEHANSVTIGAPAAELKDRLSAVYEELAHEFFHTWNLVDIAPAGYTDLNYGPQERSAGRRSIDDVMRLMYERFGGRSGFYARDLEQAVTDAGGGSAVHAFFDRYVYQGKPLDVDPYLRLLGLRLQLGWQPVVGDKGMPVADTRIYIWQPAGDSNFQLILTDPRSCWGRAGLHTGDAVVAVNGQVIGERASFYATIRALHPGDTVTLRLRASGAAAGSFRTVVVPVSGYQQPHAELLPVDDAVAEALARFREWAAGR